jgi:hypothetical protein
MAAVVGQPGSALVEQDQAERAREQRVEVAPAGLLPAVDEVDVSFADDLVRDRDAAAPGVLDLVFHRR